MTNDRHSRNRTQGELEQIQTRNEVCNNLDSERNPFDQLTFASITGLKEREYETILAAQRGRCAICGETANERPASFCNGLIPDVDQRGVVRGLLCANCHAALTLLNQDPDLIQRLATYMAKGDAVRIHSVNDREEEI